MSQPLALYTYSPTYLQAYILTALHTYSPVCVCVCVCMCVCRVVLAGFYQSTICMKWLRCASTDMCNERLFLSLCAVHLEGHSHPPAHPLLPRHTIKPAKCGEFFCVWVCYD